MGWSKRCLALGTGEERVLLLLMTLWGLETWQTLTSLSCGPVS